ncbi:MAG TPA: hypothetical protein VMF53_15395 [Alphaproteobacteria bacterium]|nr:hypothetical protein [Alphaproteobacteria bacterium]
MALRGRAFLAIWHDIASAGEAEYGVWHTRQHMPERVGVPGFLAGRRYVNWSLERERWFTLYEAATLEVFGSEGYRARLNNPTEWSLRTQPHFRNFVRSACVLSASVGRGTGGALATIRLDIAQGGRAEFEAASEALAHRIAAIDGITGAHFGIAAPDVTRVKTRESELRAATGEAVFDALAMVEGVGAREVAAALPDVRRQLGAAVKIAAEQSAVYDLAYLLRSDDLA